ncbi:hypothetical protein BDP27DRAFT_1271012, partial [Rhodocollybia butyracea]
LPLTLILVYPPSPFICAFLSSCFRLLNSHFCQLNFVLGIIRYCASYSHSGISLLTFRLFCVFAPAFAPIQDFLSLGQPRSSISIRKTSFCRNDIYLHPSVTLVTTFLCPLRGRECPPLLLQPSGRNHVLL